MELTQLKYFQAAAREGSFTRAARSLNVSQPALSKAVQHLEDEIGVKLFLRDGNRIALSYFGKLMLEEVDSAILHLETGVKNARIRAGLDQGRVSIAISEAITIPNPIEKFLVEHPGVYFQELPASTLQMEESLLDGTVDFGLTYETIANPKIVWQPLYHDRMAVLLHKEHPLAKRKEIELHELNDERVLQGDNFGRLSFVRELGSENEFLPRIVYEGTDKSLVGRLVSRNIGIAFSPVSVTLGMGKVTDFPYEDDLVVCVPLVDNFWHRTIGMVSLKDHYISQAAETLKEEIVRFFQQLPPAYGADSSRST